MPNLKHILLGFAAGLVIGVPSQLAIDTHRYAKYTMPIISKHQTAEGFASTKDLEWTTTGFSDSKQGGAVLCDGNAKYLLMRDNDRNLYLKKAP